LAASITSTGHAITVDLTTQGASGSIFQAYFLQFDPAGAQGTGNFDPFLRVQADGTESGYNTDAKKVEFDTKTGKWTHIIDLQSIDNNVPIVNGADIPGLTPGVQYREFLLDINETAGSNLLSLDALRIFQSDTPNNTGYPNLGTEIYNLGEGNSVILNYSLNPGSGQGDVAMYLPTSLFTGRYIYFYSAFGTFLPSEKGDTYESSDGFEEWGVQKSGVVPEPSSVVAFVCGIISLGGFIGKRRR
jgi:hypothetical protein